MTAQQEGAVQSDEPGRSSSQQSQGGGTDRGTLMRVASLVAGGALVVRGLRRRSLFGSLLALAGGWLAYRGIRGESPSMPSGGLSSVLPSGAGSSSTGISKTDVERSVTVDAPAEEIHEYWKDPDELSRILGDVVEISDAGEDRLHWEVSVPGDEAAIRQSSLAQSVLDRTPISQSLVERSPIGESYAWDTEFVEDEPGEILRWKTVEGTRLPSEWTVTYADAPGDRGTEVTLRAAFHPPGGPLGAKAMDRLGFAIDPMVGASLRRLKSLAETGEVPTLAGNPSGRGRGDLA